MRRSNAKNPVRRDESKRSSLAGSVIAQRLLRQHIQLAGAGVALNLTLPRRLSTVPLLVMCSTTVW